MARLSTLWLFRRLKSRLWAVKRIGRALKLFVPMTSDVLSGRFRPVPWAAFGMMTLALAYLAMPFDLIPDFLVFIGLIDDVIIVGWLLNRIDQRLADYRAWKYGDIDITTSQHSPS